MPISQGRIALSVPEDGPWMRACRLPVTAEQIAALQVLLDADDLHARERFFVAVLGAPPRRSTHRLFGRHLDGVVVRFRVLSELDLDPAEITRKIPAVLGADVASIRSKVAHLRSLGIHTTRVLNRQPSILGNAEKTISSKVKHLADYGLDAVAIFNKMPSALAVAEETIAARIAHLRALGLNLEGVVGAAPQLLTFRSEAVDEKFANFRALGLDPVVIVNKFPAALTYSMTKVLETAVILKEAGIWEGVRADWNAGYRVAMLAVPVESLALMAGAEPTQFRACPQRASKWAAAKGWKNGAARAAELSRRLSPEGVDADPDFVKTLGFASLVLAARGRNWDPFRLLASTVAVATTGGLTIPTGAVTERGRS